jgi:hypothetical protein
MIQGRMFLSDYARDDGPSLSQLVEQAAAAVQIADGNYELANPICLLWLR